MSDYLAWKTTTPKDLINIYRKSNKSIFGGSNNVGGVSTTVYSPELRVGNYKNVVKFGRPDWSLKNAIVKYSLRTGSILKQTPLGNCNEVDSVYNIVYPHKKRYRTKLKDAHNRRNAGDKSVYENMVKNWKNNLWITKDRSNALRKERFAGLMKSRNNKI